MASEKQKPAARPNEASSGEGGRTEEPTTSDVAAAAEDAATEAARIGGRVAPLSDDPAREPLEEAGEGESEGFEQAERTLRDIAEHGGQRRFPNRDVPEPEERESIEHGEADEAIPADE
jgi:hypothetical protein